MNDSVRGILKAFIQHLHSQRGNLEQITVRTLDPGKSGAFVYLAEITSHGTPDIPLIIKSGPSPLIQKELQNYQMFVEPKLRTSPHVSGELVYDGNMAAIAYKLAGFSKTFEDVPTLRTFYANLKKEDVSVALFLNVLEDLDVWWSSKELKQASVFTHYNFDFPDRFVTSYKEMLSCEYSKFLDGESRPVLDVWEFLQSSWPWKSNYSSVIHGDLNASNILIDVKANRAAVVDFASVQSHGHMFKDLAKLLREICLRLPRPNSTSEYPSFFEGQRYIHRLTILPLAGGTLPDLPTSVAQSFPFRHVFDLHVNVVLFLRRYTVDDKNWLPQAVPEVLLALWFQAQLLFLLPNEEWPGQRVNAANFCKVCEDALFKLIKQETK